MVFKNQSDDWVRWRMSTLLISCFFSFLYAQCHPFFFHSQTSNPRLYFDWFTSHGRKLIESFFIELFLFNNCLLCSFFLYPKILHFSHVTFQQKKTFCWRFVSLHDVIGPFLCWYCTEKTLLKKKISLIYHWIFIKGITITFHNNSLCVLL